METLAVIAHSEATLTEPRAFVFQGGSAGLEFFARNPVSMLKCTSREDLADLGALSFPLIYDATTDRYEVTEWTVALAKVGHALADSDRVVVIGHQSDTEELRSLQFLLASSLTAPIALMQCWDDRNPGHVWSSTSDGQVDVDAHHSVVISVGRTPLPSTLGIESHAMLVTISDEVTPSMFEISGSAIVLPATREGWRLSHNAIFRLLDVETELSTNASYPEMFGDPGAARPICSITSEILKYSKARRHDC
jgi:hypothetical protein